MRNLTRPDRHGLADTDHLKAAQALGLLSMLSVVWGKPLVAGLVSNLTPII